MGLGASTGLRDSSWESGSPSTRPVAGTALACGGYAMALLVYIFNQCSTRWYSAILTSALGYSIAAVAIVVDVGRPWFHFTASP